MEAFSPPKLRTDFVIVANSDAWLLSAQVISYLFSPESYIPFFNFNPVDIGQDYIPENPDIYAIQRRRAEHFSVFVNNVLAEHKGCETLIYVGLTDLQRTYLEIDKYFNVFEINDTADLHNYLAGVAYYKKGVVECSKAQVSTGLVVALKEDRILQIGDQNDELILPITNGETGVVIIENNQSITTIIAIAYACTISAKVYFVDRLEDDEEHDILYLLERWSIDEAGALELLKHKIQSRIATIDFNPFQHLTFFTAGLPYTLCVRDKPVSQVNIDYRPDFFIFNAILNELHNISGSAVVFSTQSFKNEETIKLTSLLEFENFYQRLLIGKTATSYNLKNTIEHYPFDLLHICSHGGSVHGTRCTVAFRDSKGNQHTVEFDHVLGINLTPYEDMHTIESMYYFRKFNGYIWKSKALKDQEFPQELYALIDKEISKAFKQKKVKILEHLNSVTNTNAIKCSSFHYLGNFDHIGGNECHPIIFNNSCWSWMTISTSFLVSGARGYIGTIRDVENKLAVDYAEAFYDSIFSNQTTITQAMYHVSTKLLPTHDENPYIFWGLHFSTLKNVNPVHRNKERILKHLGGSKGTWTRKLDSRNGGDPKLIKGIISDVNWLIGDVIGTDDQHNPKV